jgi:hypothetical protein
MRRPAYNPAVRGPPLRISCECGEVRSLRYGERWTCERCGRTWDTSRIPQDEYQGLIRDLRRYKYGAIAVAVVIAATLIPLAALVNPGLIFVVPVFLGAIAIFAGPLWKRKIRERVANRPRWELHPE